MENTERTQDFLTAHEAGLAGCTICAHVSPIGTRQCPRCGGRLSSPDLASLQRVWAWLLAGLTVYIPANIYPMLRTTTFGRTTDNTIIGGVADLWAHGDYMVGLVVFVASVVVPLFKFVVIAYLSFSIINPVAVGPWRRQMLFEIVEFIGRWSMIDVFVVAILASLVQLDFTASIKPGIAAVSFALSVVFTMLAALAFDSRLLWMNVGGQEVGDET
ncbi:paraquat-inducible protein A [Maritimibacter dapengensis]|uniref:Paraquat-inducible protein A n=1 Tax=Maritimibacter dapengensis TaxID=2836868 RepID=A0ABS6SY57_9RHOB|nr:paraquat-inducible protein A [Maritimibacter dapengensis]